MDLSLALATGIDIPIPECQLVVHQPTIKEIGAVGEKEFFTAIQCLCISNQMDRTDLEGVSNFQIFIIQIYKIYIKEVTSWVECQ